MENNISLVTLVNRDVTDFLNNINNSNKRILFESEQEFQLELVIYLRSTNHYDLVKIEQQLYCSMLSNYVWKKSKDTTIRIDIVVKKGDEYLPIELKFKTKEIKRNSDIFGIIKEDFPVVHTQSATNYGKYDFWKDVRRLELLKENFSGVRNGIAVFVTNDFSYVNDNNCNAEYFNFNMIEGKHGTKKHWLSENISNFKQCPNFDLSNEYYIHWNDIDIDNESFKYCIVTV